MVLSSQFVFNSYSLSTKVHNIPLKLYNTPFSICLLVYSTHINIQICLLQFKNVNLTIIIYTKYTSHKYNIYTVIETIQITKNKNSASRHYYIGINTLTRLSVSSAATTRPVNDFTSSIKYDT